MRLLLDAHISKRIAAALRRRGHDVLAADEQRTLDGWSDEDLLALAHRDDRVLVTFDVKDFPGIVRRWSEAQRPHAGCLIVVGIDHSEYGTIVRGLERAFAARAEAADWRDYTAFVARCGELARRLHAGIHVGVEKFSPPGFRGEIDVIRHVAEDGQGNAAHRGSPARVACRRGHLREPRISFAFALQLRDGRRPALPVHAVWEAGRLRRRRAPHAPRQASK